MRIQEILLHYINSNESLRRLKNNKVWTLLRDFYMRYFKFMLSSKVNKYGYKIIEIISCISDKTNIPIWIDWGTLLGYVREKKIIEHDDDLDFGCYCLNDKEHQKIINELQSFGIRRVRQFRDENELILESFEFKNLLFDLFYYEKEEGMISWRMFERTEDTNIKFEKGVEKSKGYNVYKYSFVDKGIKCGRYGNGVECILPKDEYMRIRELYGADWNTPIKNFDWKSLNNFEIKGFDGNISGIKKK